MFYLIQIFGGFIHANCGISKRDLNYTVGQEQLTENISLESSVSGDNPDRWKIPCKNPLVCHRGLNYSTAGDISWHRILFRTSRVSCCALLLMFSLLYTQGMLTKNFNEEERDLTPPSMLTNRRSFGTHRGL